MVVILFKIIINVHGILTIKTNESKTYNLAMTFLLCDLIIHCDYLLFMCNEPSKVIIKHWNEKISRRQQNSILTWTLNDVRCKAIVNHKSMNSLQVISGYNIPSLFQTLLESIKWKHAPKVCLLKMSFWWVKYFQIRVYLKFCFQQYHTWYFHNWKWKTCICPHTHIFFHPRRSFLCYCKVVSGSWMYATHRLMVIHPFAKYGKPMSNHKQVMGRTRICTDRRTDRRTFRVIPIYPLNFVRGGYKKYFSEVVIA